VDEWDEREKLRKEKEALGFYITGHPLDRFKTEVRRFATCPIEGLPNLRDKSAIKVAGVIENLRIKRTKRGEKMAVLVLEDTSGSTEVVLFPDVFNTHSALLKDDEPLLISGTAEVDGASAKIIAQGLEAMETVRQRYIKGIELPLHAPMATKDSLEQLRDVFSRYPGQCSVLFRVETGKGKALIIAAHDHYKVLPCEEMRGEIEALIGEKVTYRYGEKNSNAGQSAYP
jgi:DNA polymerase-3 subunit alpha